MGFKEKYPFHYHLLCIHRWYILCIQNCSIIYGIKVKSQMLVLVQLSVSILPIHSLSLNDLHRFHNLSSGHVITIYYIPVTKIIYHLHLQVFLVCVFIQGLFSLRLLTSFTSFLEYYAFLRSPLYRPTHSHIF